MSGRCSASLTATTKTELVKSSPVHCCGNRLAPPGAIANSLRAFNANGEIAAFQGLHRVVAGLFAGIVPMIPFDPAWPIDFVPVDVVADAIACVVQNQVSEGEFWLRQRRLAQPAFAKQRIAAYGDVMVRYTERLLAGWVEGESRDIAVEMMRLTLEIAAKILFDADGGGRASEVGSALEVDQLNFAARVNKLLAIPMWIPTRRNRRMRRAVQKLDEIIYGFIKQRRASGDDKGDLLSMLLHAQDETDQSRMTDKQLRDEAMTIFLAGHETTALALSWSRTRAVSPATWWCRSLGIRSSRSTGLSSSRLMRQPISRRTARPRSWCAPFWVRWPSSRRRLPSTAR